MIKIDLDDILARIADIEGIKFTDTELGTVFGKKRSTVSSWRARGSIPYADIIEYCEKQNVSLDKVFFNKPAVNISADIIEAIVLATKKHPLTDAKLKKVTAMVISKWPLSHSELELIIDLAT